MSAPDRLSPALHAWLEGGTRPLSGDVRVAVFDALPDIRQDRAPSQRWKVAHTGASQGQGFATRLLGGAGIVMAALLAVAVALAVVGQTPSTASRFTPGSIAFTRDGGLFVAAPDGSEPVAIGASDVSEDQEFAFSPDSSYLAYIAGSAYPDTDTELIVVGANGRRLWSLPNDWYSTFSWAPEGDAIASYTYRTAAVSVLGIDGMSRRAVSLPGQLSDPWLGRDSPTPLAWSPDGRWLAAPFGYKEGGHYIVIAADGSPRTFGQLEGLAQYPYGPFAWAPDSRLALTLQWGEVAVLSDGGDLRTVPLPEGTAGSMAWSPDGTQLAVSTQSGMSRSARIVVIDGDGASRVLPIDQTALSLAPDVGGIGPVDWSPDGRRILFISNAGMDAPVSAIWSVDLATLDLQQLVRGVDGYRFDVAGTPGAGGRGR